MAYSFVFLVYFINFVFLIQSNNMEMMSNKEKRELK